MFYKSLSSLCVLENIQTLTSIASKTDRERLEKCLTSDLLDCGGGVHKKTVYRYFFRATCYRCGVGLTAGDRIYYCFQDINIFDVV